MPKVSVIVPVYNVEAYLPQCLDSIASQSYTDFELILVDDGSTDQSGTICDGFAEKNAYAKVIHQPNRGVATARNAGISASTGEYAAFIDSDDIVTTDYLEYLLSLIQKYRAEISIADLSKFTTHISPKASKENSNEECVDAGKALEKICYAKYPIYLWGKLYKRSLFDSIRFPDGHVYEDIATLYKIIGNAHKVAYGHKQVYFWRQQSASITHQRVTEAHMYGLTAVENQLQYMKAHYPQAVPAAKARCVMKAVDTAYRIVMGDENKELFQRSRAYIRPYISDVIKDPHVSKSVKVRGYSLKMGYAPFLVISWIYYYVNNGKGKILKKSP